MTSGQKGRGVVKRGLISGKRVFVAAGPKGRAAIWCRIITSSGADWLLEAVVMRAICSE